MTAWWEPMRARWGRRSRRRGHFARGFWTWAPIFPMMGAMKRALTGTMVAGVGLSTWMLMPFLASSPLAPSKQRPPAVVGPLAPARAAHDPVPRAPWASRLVQRIYGEMAPYPEGDIGVFVLDLERGYGAGYHDDKPMYLASGVKLLIMIELYRQREAGLLRFDEELLYTTDDVRDGAPAMNRLPRGKKYAVDQLLVYMLRDSDNAAADLLAERVGWNQIQRGLLGDGFSGIGPLVPLLDVRREVYRRLDPRADKLSMLEVRDIRWRNGFHPRLDLLKKHIGAPYGDYGRDDLDAAYTDYYRLGRNHAPMRTIGAIYERMWRRELVSAEASEEMLERLLGVWSSGHRIRGAVPEGVPVHHKTGTQHERICDLAVVVLEDGRPLIMAIAVEGIEREKAEPIMFDVARTAFDLATADGRRAEGGRDVPHGEKLTGVRPDRPPGT